MKRIESLITATTCTHTSLFACAHTLAPALGRYYRRQRNAGRWGLEKPEAPDDAVDGAPGSPTTYTQLGSREEQIDYRKKSVRAMLGSVERLSQLSLGPAPGHEYMPCIPEADVSLLPVVVGAMAEEDPRLTMVFLQSAIEALKGRTQLLLEQVDSHGYTASYRALAAVGTDQPCSASNRPYNELKNRYLNILAYDRTRVVLPITNPDDPDTDYINANWVPGIGGPRTYIATQGPVPNSMISFWRMVWEYRVEIIVMVTNEVERGRLKCHRYWPESPKGGAGASQSYGQHHKVTHLGTERHPCWVVRLFEIEYTGWTRRVRQVAYTAWPDHGVPNTTRELLLLRSQIHRLATDKTAPLLVHCSAGVGRTGTYIGIDRLLNQCLLSRGPLDVDATCRDMRMSRNMMVQTEEQYMCIHASVLDGMTELLKQESARLKESRDSHRERHAGRGASSPGGSQPPDPVYDNYQRAMATGGAAAAAVKRLSGASQASIQTLRRPSDPALDRPSSTATEATLRHSETSAVFPGYQLTTDSDTLRLKSVRRENPMFRVLTDLAPADPELEPAAPARARNDTLWFEQPDAAPCQGDVTQPPAQPPVRAHSLPARRPLLADGSAESGASCPPQAHTHPKASPKTGRARPDPPAQLSPKLNRELRRRTIDARLEALRLGSAPGDAPSEPLGQPVAARLSPRSTLERGRKSEGDVKVMATSAGFTPVPVMATVTECEEDPLPPAAMAHSSAADLELGGAEVPAPDCSVTLDHVRGAALLAAVAEQGRRPSNLSALSVRTTSYNEAVEVLTASIPKPIDVGSAAFIVAGNEC